MKFTELAHIIGRDQRGLYGVLCGTNGKLNASHGIAYVYSKTSPCGANTLPHAATTCVWHVCNYSRKLHTYKRMWLPIPHESTTKRT